MGFDNAIEAAHLVKRYGAVTAVADLSLRVPRGQIFGFLGPNGAGKTTAVKLLLGLARATSGTGLLLGKPLGDRAARARIGYLPELFRYPDWLTAREVLRFHARLAQLQSRRTDEAVRHALDIVGLSGRSDDRVGGFSKGMQQRLGLGVALLGEPQLIVLDEPTSALDPVGRSDVREILRTLKLRGATIFLNSHLLTEVERVCDRVAVVDRGRVIAAGSIEDIVGVADGVRVKCVPDQEASAQLLARFGRVSRDGESFIVRGVASERVPDLVRVLVESGARVYEVEPVGATLEERFLELVRAAP